MKGDPTTERARSVVMLVILTVAVPSILLTALAAVAVENEEAATRQRLEIGYTPVVGDAANHFNSRVDQLLADSAVPLGELVKRAQGEEADTSLIEAFVSATGDLAINYFVVDPGGEVKVPRACEEEEESSDCKPSCDSFEKQSPEQLMRKARELIERARDPLRPQREVAATATRLRKQLEKAGSKTACTRDMLRAIADRDATLAQLSLLSHQRNTPARVHTVESNEWRRVVVAQGIDGWFAGYELVGCSFEPLLNQLLAEKNLAEGVRTHIYSVQLPKDYAKKSEIEAYEKTVLKWVLLKRTHLAWVLAVVAEDQAGLLSITTSRSTLYFWALILIGAALVAGIGYTIRTVAKEARLARLKTDFVSSVSHDLRTPLTSIRMFTETLLLGRAASKEEEREFLKVIADETDRLSRLTERILDFSRMEAGRKAYQFVPSEIPELVGQALRACRPMIEEARFEVKTIFEESLPAIEVDRDAMVEVLINLISNAIKYSPNERSMIIRAFVEGPRVGISVADRGIGISKSEHSKIFEKFYRVDSRRSGEVSGTGLGLSLVRHIVTAHGGEVTVQSALDHGSTFTVWLPSPAPAVEPLEVRTWRPSSS